jgi:hypothetical protein
MNDAAAPLQPERVRELMTWLEGSYPPAEGENLQGEHFEAAKIVMDDLYALPATVAFIEACFRRVASDVISFDSVGFRDHKKKTVRLGPEWLGYYKVLLSPNTGEYSQHYFIEVSETRQS